MSEALESAQILHFASKDKPWLFYDVIFADQWFDVFQAANLRLPLNLSSINVSVIIPAYNIEKYLNSCLDSICSTDALDIEIIVVDDGSLDRTSAIIEARKQRDGRLVAIHQSNAGQSAARNRALKVARGEFVYFLDGDDMLKPGALSEFFLYSKNNQLDILYFDGESFFESSDLEASFGDYKSYYSRKMGKTKVISGLKMFDAQAKSNSFKRNRPITTAVRFP